MPLSPLAEAAIAYAARGWAVLPLHSPVKGGCSCGRPCGSVGKHPRTANGLKDASSDVAQIEGWWAKWPEANVGLVTGVNFDVLDLDTPDAVAAFEVLLWNEHKDPRSLPSVYTSKGVHFYFAPTGLGNSAGFRPGWDWRGAGGYVVAPPSVHAGGSLYDWRCAVNGALPAAPLGVVAAMRERPKAAATVTAGAVLEGGRNQALTSLAGTMRRRGMSPAAIEAALLAENRDRCQPPLDEEEVRAIAGSVSRYAPESEPPQFPAEPGDDGSSLGAVPAFPLEVLPEEVRRLAESSRGSGLPTAYLAAACLAALSVAVGPQGRIERPGWRQRAILWPVVMGPSGSAKSPALDLAFRPLRDFDAAHWDQQAVDESFGTKHRAKDPTLLLGDTTLEALSERLAAGDGSAGVVRDELSQLLGGFGEYKRGSSQGDRARYLELWSGTPFRTSRITRTPLLVQTPTVVIVGCLAPGDHQLLGPTGAGFRPRWLPHLGTFVGDRDESTPSTAQWDRLLTAGLLPVRAMPRTWSLTEAADRAFRDAQERWAAQARQHEPASVAAALHKADVQAFRIALVLAEADEPGKGGQVGPDVVERAAAWMDYVLDCWRALPEDGSLALSRRDEVLDTGVERLREFLEEHGGEATRREIQRARVGGCRTGEQLAALITHYSDTFPGTVSDVTKHQGGVTTVVRAPYRLPVQNRGSGVTAPKAGVTASKGRSSVASPGVTKLPSVIPPPSLNDSEIKTTSLGAQVSPNDPYSAPPAEEAELAQVLIDHGVVTPETGLATPETTSANAAEAVTESRGGGGAASSPLPEPLAAGRLAHAGAEPIGQPEPLPPGRGYECDHCRKPGPTFKLGPHELCAVCVEERRAKAAEKAATVPPAVEVEL